MVGVSQGFLILKVSHKIITMPLNQPYLIVIKTKTKTFYDKWDGSAFV